MRKNGFAVILPIIVAACIFAGSLLYINRGFFVKTDNISSNILGGPSVIGISQGGLATSTAPSAGQLLQGNAGGKYDLVASNTLPYQSKGNYLTTSSNLGPANFSSQNVSQWTNDAGYITAGGDEPLWVAASHSLSVANFATDTVSQWKNDAGYITSSATGINTSSVLSLFSATAPLSYTTSSASGTFSMTRANTSTDGYLASTDFVNFNSKVTSETDPVWNTASSSYVRWDAPSTTLWDTAYLWGNHASAGYTTSTHIGTSTIGYAAVYNSANSVTGTSYLFVSSTGQVGINSTSPIAQLGVQGQASSLPLLDIASSTGSSLLRVTAGGKVGIGTSTPQNVLSVVSSLTGNGDGVTAVSINTTNAWNWMDTLLSLKANNTLKFEVTGRGDAHARSFTADVGFSSWNNGIGLTLTGQALDGATAVGGYFNNFNALSTPGSKLFSIRNAQVEKAYFDYLGNLYIGNGTVTSTYQSNAVGIASTSPVAKLGIQGLVADGSLPLLDIASSTGSSLLRVLANGNVGIGTTSPQASLSVQNLNVPTTNTYAMIVSDRTSTPLWTIDSLGNIASRNSGSYYEASTSISYINSLQTGPLNFDDDAGLIQWVDLPFVSTTIAKGTPMAYTAYMNAYPMITVYGEANGSGALTGTSTMIGFGTTTPQYFIDAFASSSQNILRLSTSTNSQILVVNANGYMGLNSTTPNYQLDVNGNINGNQLCIAGVCNSVWPSSSGGTSVLQGTTGQIPYYATVNTTTLTATSSITVSTTGHISAPFLNSVVTLDGTKYTQDSTGITNALAFDTERLFIPSGTYTLTNAVTTTNANIPVSGEGEFITTLSKGNSVNGSTIEINGAGQSISNLSINGNKANQTSGDGIHTNWDNNNLSLSNLYIYNTYGNGILLNGISNGSVTNNYISAAGANGVDINTTGQGIQVCSATQTLVANNTIANSTSSAIGLMCNSHFNNDFTRVLGNDLSGVKGDEQSGIHNWIGDKSVIANNIIHDQASTALGVNGIFNLGDRMVINGNLIYNVGGVGIEMNTGSQFGVVSNNSITGNTAGTAGNGIYVGGASSSFTSITDNVIAQPNQHGIYLDTNATGTLIMGNFIGSSVNTSSDRAAVRMKGANSYTRIIGNTFYGTGNTQYGIYADGATPSAQSLEIWGNNVFGMKVANDFGIVTSSLSPMWLRSGLLVSNGTTTINGPICFYGDCKTAWPTSSGGGSGTVLQGTTGQFPYYASANTTTLSATSTLTVTATRLVGVNSSSPIAAFGINQISGTATNQSLFNVVSSTGSSLFNITADGNIATYSNGFFYQASSTKTFINSLQTGPWSFPDDAGSVNLVNMRLTTGAAGTVESISIAIDDVAGLTVRGEENGAGVVKDIKTIFQNGFCVKTPDGCGCYIPLTSSTAVALTPTSTAKCLPHL